jgi:hypothetical protein
MSIAEISTTARSMLRDFPKYFEVEEGPLNVLTIRLPHPLVSPAMLQVYIGSPGADPGDPMTTTATQAWSLDDRNGLLKLTDEEVLNKQVLVSGYYYTWFSDSDMEMHAHQMADEILYNAEGDYDDLDGVMGEVTAIGTVVRALWSLMLEFSFDIDVSTPEGMYIPARQRFQQVAQALTYWENEFNQKAAALNIGLNAIGIGRLRRVARLTNRYVPVYQEREFDDPRFPKRLYPAIPREVPPGPERSDDIIEVVTEGDYPSPEERYRYGQDIGWTSIGTRGEWP